MCMANTRTAEEPGRTLAYLDANASSPSADDAAAAAAGQAGGAIFQQRRVMLSSLWHYLDSFFAFVSFPSVFCRLVFSCFLCFGCIRQRSCD